MKNMFEKISHKFWALLLGATDKSLVLLEKSQQTLRTFSYWLIRKTEPQEKIVFHNELIKFALEDCSTVREVGTLTVTPENLYMARKTRLGPTGATFASAKKETR